jgi:hypothetical protein
MERYGVVSMNILDYFVRGKSGLESLIPEMRVAFLTQQPGKNREATKKELRDLWKSFVMSTHLTLTCVGVGSRGRSRW